MNELHTPPGYVEYPRDPKYRLVDEIGRFEQTLRAYQGIQRPIVVSLLAIGLFPHHSFSWIAFMFQATISFFVFLALAHGLAKLCRAQGWSFWLAILLAFIPTVVCGLWPFGAGQIFTKFVAEIAALMAVQGFVEVAVRNESRRYGLNRYRYKLTKKGKVEEIVAALRMREAQTNRDVQSL